MATVRTFTLPHYNAYPVHVALFTDVKNVAFLRSQLLASNPDFDYAFIDAAMILTPAHLLSALFTTLHALTTHTQKTRTPHSELIYRLSPTNNISTAYKTFGLTDATTSLIAVKLPVKMDGSTDLTVTRETVARHLGEVVEGVSVDVGEEGEAVGSNADVHRIKGVYKVGCGKGKKGEGKASRGDIEGVVLGAIALKGW